MWVLSATQMISSSKQVSVADVTKILRQFGVSVNNFRHYQMIGNETFESDITGGCLTNVVLIFSARHRTLSVRLATSDARITESDVLTTFSECRQVPKIGSHTTLHPPFYDLALTRESDSITFVNNDGKYISEIEISRASISPFPDSLKRMMGDGG